MPTYRSQIPYNEYRKRRRAFRKAQEQKWAKEAEEKRQQELAWFGQSQKLMRAKQEHPVAYFFGSTEAQQEIFGKISFTNRVFGLGKVTENNPTGSFGLFTSFVLLLLFFPLLLLSHPHQFPVLQIIGFIALGIECYRYKRGSALKHEWKIVLGVVTVIGWIFFLSLRR